MQHLKRLTNQTKPIFFSCGYLALITILIYFKTKPYDFNLSSLIGIWKGFAELNPSLIDEGFIIYNDGGYDGQFFYLISKSLFINGFENFPILDSFYLRFNRLGTSILSGIISIVAGFKYYPIITLSILTFLHLISYTILHKILNQENKFLALFYLFSPFTLNSILLLVSDSLFVSFAVICIYLLGRLGLNLFNNSLAKKSSGGMYISTFLILTFTCFIRESGLVLLGTFFLVGIFEKKYKISFLILSAILIYLLTTLLFKLILITHLGTNPLGFLQLIDYPFFGFFKSIQLHSFLDLKSILRELSKFPIFLFYILLALNAKNISNFRDIVLYLPIFFILFTAGIGDVGYWLSFDNISRMFALSIAWIILLKNNFSLYKEYYSLLVSFLILISLIIRIVYIKSAMTFYIQ